MAHWARPVLRWLRRYLPAEALGTVSAIAGVAGAQWAGLSPHATAVCGTAAETVGYYTVLLVRDSVARPRPRARAVVLTLRGLAVEFGPAEVVDTLLVRPALLYTGMLFAEDVVVGTIVGKLAADLIFYCIVAPCCVLRRRWAG